MASSVLQVLFRPVLLLLLLLGLLLLLLLQLPPLLSLLLLLLLYLLLLFYIHAMHECQVLFLVLRIEVFMSDVFTTLPISRFEWRSVIENDKLVNLRTSK